ncbi:hypothetical protein DB44_CW00530 [Candidatus Protochlamydia amoebophila]|uniref:Uncharacterized protein n=1 Tax=Candidatus Protochlamydia amoebophila TaxID=362787 RepID=A0A0C1JKR1_9BACT|nr:hypothetical protein DB44_CW00530 [Candidatus Protochlamydia amoebophila]
MAWLSFDLTKIHVEKILSKRNTSINLKFDLKVIACFDKGQSKECFHRK